jgi:K+-sensing histidine kinase KdpD
VGGRKGWQRVVSVKVKSRRDRSAYATALLGPLAISAVLVPFRGSFPNTDAALVMVLGIVAVAANGVLLAGTLASASAALWYDFFLTRPFESFSITRRGDIETTVLLLVIGFGVSKLAVWGRRQASLASRQADYLTGLHDAAAAAASGTSVSVLITDISRQLTRLLGLEQCRFQRGVAGVGQPARLLADGRVVVGRAEWNVEDRGLPSSQEIELVVDGGGVLQGRFLLRSAGKARPTRAQRLVAIAFADQLGLALAAQQSVA